MHDGTEPVKETVYSGNMVYENGQLQFIQHEEGRAMMVDSEGQDILSLTKKAY